MYYYCFYTLIEIILSPIRLKKRALWQSECGLKWLNFTLNRSENDDVPEMITRMFRVFRQVLIIYVEFTEDVFL
jgi:hypothetical protein